MQPKINKFIKKKKKKKEDQLASQEEGHFIFTFNMMFFWSMHLSPVGWRGVGISSLLLALPSPLGEPC